MTELMQLLYNYILETEFRSQLYTEQYRIQKLSVNQLAHQLQQVLPEDLRPLLDSYREALGLRQSFELEAMFLSALTLARALP